MKKNILTVFILFVLSIGVLWASCFSVIKCDYLDKCPNGAFIKNEYRPNAEYYCSPSVNPYNGCNTLPFEPKYQRNIEYDLPKCTGEIVSCSA